MISEVDPETIVRQVAAALDEDVGQGDLTAALVPESRLLSVQVITRTAGILAGTAWFSAVFHQLDPAITLNWHRAEGDSLEPGQLLCEMSGPARAILAGERTALNFLQLLSGTATAAHRYASAVDGTRARILDTRKTIPGLRLAQKHAVRVGGAHNHRIGLFDAILVKENHIEAAGGIRPALARARELHPNKPVEVEVENLEQLAQAVEGAADRAMLDNFELAAMQAAVEQYGQRIELEASGGITLDTVRGIAETGVHFISVGEITKRVEPLDLSMRFKDNSSAAN